MAAIKQILFWTLVSFVGLCIFSVVLNDGNATEIGFPKPFYSSSTMVFETGTGTTLSFVLNYFLIDLLVAAGIGTLITLGNTILKRRYE